MNANLSPEARGYIAELHQQVQSLSERCAQLSASFYAARQEAALLKAELDSLRQQTAAEHTQGGDDARSDATQTDGR